LSQSPRIAGSEPAPGPSGAESVKLNRVVSIGEILPSLLDEICRRIAAANASPPPLLTLDGVANLLACSRPSIERMRASGRLPKADLHVGLGRGSSPRWKRQTIDAWIARGGRL
jgi:predicted DNA-binding transcriptional regulator AlpA